MSVNVHANVYMCTMGGLVRMADITVPQAPAAAARELVVKQGAHRAIASREEGEGGVV
eukprot:COSAG06_NODE_1534_length_9156_cov_13.526554_5_plen_58_part_00